MAPYRVSAIRDDTTTTGRSRLHLIEEHDEYHKYTAKKRGDHQRRPTERTDEQECADNQLNENKRPHNDVCRNTWQHPLADDFDSADAVGWREPLGGTRHDEYKSKSYLTESSDHHETSRAKTHTRPTI